MSDGQYLERYFLNHGAGMFPHQEQLMAAAMADFASDWCRSDNWDRSLAKREEFLAAWAEELGTTAETLCTTENVTTGLSILIGALSTKTLSGKTILIAQDCFPSLHFLLAGLQQRYNFTLRTVEDKGARYVRDDAYLAAWDENVALAIVTWVGSTSSHRVDLSRMVAHGKKMGSLICADLTQGAGLIPVNVVNTNLDFAITTSLKWACGSPGAGVVYVKSEQLENCRPELRGWFSQDDPFSWQLDNFRFAGDSSRLQNGTPSVLACYASLPGFAWRAKIGRENILAHNRKLTGKLIGYGEKNDWNILTPLAPDERGGSIMVEIPDKISGTGLAAMLSEQNFTTDQRGSVLRLSPGYTTREAAVDMLDEILGSMLAIAH